MVRAHIFHEPLPPFSPLGPGGGASTSSGRTASQPSSRQNPNPSQVGACSTASRRL